MGLKMAYNRVQRGLIEKEGNGDVVDADDADDDDGDDTNIHCIVPVQNISHSILLKEILRTFFWTKIILTHQIHQMNGSLFKWL